MRPEDNPHAFIPKRNRLHLEVKVLKSVLTKIKVKNEGNKRVNDSADGPFSVMPLDDGPERRRGKPKGFGQVGGIRLVVNNNGVYRYISKRHF